MSVRESDVATIDRLRSRMEAEELLPDPALDQFFLFDVEIIDAVVKAAGVGADDDVLEIGGGYGGITALLAARANHVVTIELDERFVSLLESIGDNVTVHVGDGLRYVRSLAADEAPRWKLVANLPYSLCEPVLHELIRLAFARVALIVPTRFARTVVDHALFSAYLRARRVRHVSRFSSTPVPRTPSEIVLIERVPRESLTVDAALRRYVYRHRVQLLRNSLREGLVAHAADAHGVRLTKNEARAIVRAAVDAHGVDAGVLDAAAGTRREPYAAVVQMAPTLERSFCDAVGPKTGQTGRFLE